MHLGATGPDVEDITAFSGVERNALVLVRGSILVGSGLQMGVVPPAGIDEIGVLGSWSDEKGRWGIGTCLRSQGDMYVPNVPSQISSTFLQKLGAGKAGDGTGTQSAEPSK